MRESRGRDRDATAVSRNSVVAVSEWVREGETEGERE